LLKYAGALGEADAAMSARITPELIREVVALVPDAWLATDRAFATPAAARAAYSRHLARRLQGGDAWQSEFRGRRASAGRGTIGLRIGVGGTLVHESRVRNQGMRAGLMGSELETSAFRLLPAADLDAVVALHVAGPWLLMTSGGPSVDLLDGKLHGGWSAQLGVAWQP